MEDTIGENVNAQPSIDVLIDWQQYFRDFCDTHGKHFVVYENDWLLFPDGYRYYALNYEGPEIPPPVSPDERTKLLVFYWERRRHICQLEYRRVTEYKRELQELQQTRSAPISKRVSFKDDEGKIVNTTARLDMSIIDRRLKWLENDILEATQELESLKNAR